MLKRQKKDPSRATTAIRPRSLRRAHIVRSMLNETMMHFISEATDARCAKEIKRHNIVLPPDAQFDTPATQS